MAKTYNRLEIDVNKKPNSIGIRPVQNDTKSRYLDVCLYENGVPIDLTGEQVRITFRKADGSTFFNQGEVTDAAAGRCQFALTNEILSEAKAVETQISVWNVGGQILSTQVFEIYVTAAIPWTDSVESENEYGVLVVLFQEIQDALDTMHKIAAAFGEPGDKAAEYGVDTFWGILETLAGRGDVEGALQNKIKAYLNSTVGTSGFQSLDKILDKAINERSAVITSNTTFKIPPGVEVINVLFATSAGEDGETGSGLSAGAGGDAGRFIINFPYPVKGLSTLPITVGSGNTIIGSLITLLKGSGVTGGAAGARSSPYTGEGGKIPDELKAMWGAILVAGAGGERGYSYGYGGTGGKGLCCSGGGGGGASGSGGNTDQSGEDATGFGCGGGGCGGKDNYGNGDKNRVPGKGSPGIVILAW